MDLDIPPGAPGIFAVRFFDHGGVGDDSDSSAFWAYCSALPRTGELVMAPDGKMRSVFRVWHNFIPIAVKGSEYRYMGIFVELEPSDERIEADKSDPRPE